MTGPLPLSVLRRLLRSEPGEAPGHACQRCGVTLPADHPHLADIGTRALNCVCAACHAAASAAPGEEDEGTSRPVPRRFVRLPEAAITEEEWDAFQIPVGIAFVFHNSSLGRTVVSYPSPAGATESLLPPDAWERMLRSNPWMGAIAPDVEALLVRRTQAARDCFVVPIDTCYELAGRIRSRWSGFGGGPEVREEIDTFFLTLRERSEVVAP